MSCRARNERQRDHAATRAESRFLRLALAVAALAAIDDAVLDPERGTGAADHVTAALVPVAIAVALAFVLPRLRAGARATAAIACGSLALTAGVADGVRHAVLAGPGGDDFSASAAAVAGALLVAWGTRLLWTTRRRDERPLRRYSRRALTAAAAVVAAFLVLLPVASAIVATHRARETAAVADLGRPYRDVTFSTADGLRLAGWFVPSLNGAAVIAVPGRSGPVRQARMLARNGYGVLLYDRRGEGASDGDFNAFGWDDAADVVAAARFLTAEGIAPDRIGGLGLSVGGEAMLEAAATSGLLRAVVSEGAGARSLAEHWDDPGPATLGKPITPLAAQTAALVVLTGRGPPPSIADLVGDIAPRPLLLIRGLEGQPQERLNRVYLAAAGAPKSLWEVAGAGHTAALPARPAEYERRVAGFFDRALLPARSVRADRG
jgi:hypothetical protein